MKGMRRMRIRGFCRGARSGLRGILKRSAPRPGAGCGYLALVALVALPTSVALAAAARRGSPTRARLQGSFLLAGRVTAAKNISGEHVGQNVARTWTFNSRCRTGECATVSLVRTRTGGRDALVLHRKSPGYYTGSGSFYAPLRCGSHTWPRGETVPFTVTVRVSAAAMVGRVDLATRVSAVYTNRSRGNRTPCVAVLGHDAATYHGRLVAPAPPSGGIGP
jgi:hypothetical protein